MAVSGNKKIKNSTAPVTVPVTTPVTAPIASILFRARLEGKEREKYIEMARTAEGFLNRIVSLDVKDTSEYQSFMKTTNDYFDNLRKSNPMTYEESNMYRKRISEALSRRFGNPVIID